MLRHVIDMLTNTYYILNEDDVVVFSIELKNDQVYARGCVNVFKGDITKLEFKSQEETQN